MRDCVIGNSWEECVQKSNPTLEMHKFYFNNGAYIVDKHLEGIRISDDLTYEILSKDRFIFGSLSQCVDQMTMWKEVVKPDYLMLRMRQPGGAAQVEALNDIKNFSDKIMANI